jgi:hypothetical protein
VNDRTWTETPHCALDLRVHTIAQFVAEFFSNWSDGIDYGDFRPAPCWNGYVAWVAEAENMLEDIVQQVLRGTKGGEMDEWYSVLEECGQALRERLIANNGWTSADELRPLFEASVRRHVETQ